LTLEPIEMVVAGIKSSIFKVIVDAVSEIVDTVVMDFGEEGVRMQAMDASHVSLCFLQLDREGFKDYACEAPKNVGVSLSNMSKIFKCTSADDDLEIRVEDGDKMHLHFKGSSRASDFEMRLMEIDSEFLQIPAVDYECVVTMPSPEFQKMVRDVAVMGETCTIEVSDGDVTLSSDGDIGRATFRPLDGSKISVTGSTRGRYAVKYIQMFTRASPLCKQVVLRMSEGNPVCVEYEIEHVGVLKYYLAPKIEDDQDMDE
jgi:proliferating cell nuclear antigen